MTSPEDPLWWPEALHRVIEDPEALAEYAYVVLEEAVDQRFVLLAWTWPRADVSGHLYWPERPERGPKSATIDGHLLRDQVYRPSRIHREPRLGDVYAAARLGQGWDSGEVVQDARTLFAGPVYDISAEAREAAKLSYLGALAPVEGVEEGNDEARRLLAEAARRREAMPVRTLKVSQRGTSARRGPGS